MTDKDNTPRGSLATRVLMQIRELILNGEFAPGDRIAELSIVERFGMSRTPVRLALDRLEKEGLVEHLPSGGFGVRRIDLAEVFDSIELRGIIEGAAAMRAAERRPPRADLNELRDCTGSMQAVLDRGAFDVDDLADFVRLNDRYHELLIALSGSVVLQRALDRSIALPFAAPGAFFLGIESSELHRSLLVAQEQHRSILEAIEKGQGARAEALCREHALQPRRNVEKLLHNKEKLPRLQTGKLLAMVS
jgi:GntR family transcriptional regulator of vanillate catabolism